jgi:hypothetical protein
MIGARTPACRKEIAAEKWTNQLCAYFAALRGKADRSARKSAFVEYVRLCRRTAICVIREERQGPEPVHARNAMNPGILSCNQDTFPFQMTVLEPVRIAH